MRFIKLHSIDSSLWDRDSISALVQRKLDRPRITNVLWCMESVTLSENFVVAMRMNRLHSLSRRCVRGCHLNRPSGCRFVATAASYENAWPEGDVKRPKNDYRLTSIIKLEKGRTDQTRGGRSRSGQIRESKTSCVIKGLKDYRVSVFSVLTLERTRRTRSTTVACDDFHPFCRPLFLCPFCITSFVPMLARCFPSVLPLKNKN